MAEDANNSDAVCSLCATSFCAACDMPPHAPATCEMVAQWEEKGGYVETGKAEDVEARKLKHLTTKPCPRCGVRIEKNGGCPVSFCLLQKSIVAYKPSTFHYIAYDLCATKLQISILLGMFG
jgi:hypothetical protein